VPGLAGDVAKAVVKPAGFAIGEKADAPTGLSTSVIMFDPEQEGAEESAAELADAVADELGETKVQPIVPEVAELSGGSPLVLVLGQDDGTVLESSTDTG
jgi:hypothetical protein